MTDLIRCTLSFTKEQWAHLEKERKRLGLRSMADANRRIIDRDRGVV